MKEMAGFDSGDDEVSRCYTDVFFKCDSILIRQHWTKSVEPIAERFQIQPLLSVHRVGVHLFPQANCSSSQQSPCVSQRTVFLF
jgi:hypothetical protein